MVQFPLSLAGNRGSLSNPSQTTIQIRAMSQTLFPANTHRHILFIYNRSADTLWIDFGVAAIQDAPSIPIEPGGIFRANYLEFIDTRQVNIIGPTAGAKFTAKEG